MLVEPAHIDQVRRAKNGAMVHIPADAGGVAEELRRIHPALKLRYSEAGEYWAVFHESEDGRDTYLILTAQDCDHRICERIRFIDSQGRSGYDYARELETASREVKDRAARRFREQIEQHAELAAHALRRDLGARYKGRAFIPREVPNAG